MEKPESKTTGDRARPRSARSRKPSRREVADAALAATCAEMKRAVGGLQALLAERRLVEERRHLTARALEMAHEDDLRAISRELHESVSQHVVVLALGLQALRDGRVSDSIGHLESLQAITDALGKKVYELVLKLHPTSLDDVGLPQTLANYLGSWSQISGIVVELHSAGWPPGRRLIHVESVLYRVIGDALNRIVRPAGASRVSIVLEQRAGQAVAIIEEDGKNTAAGSRALVPAGRALPWSVLRERMAPFDGDLTVQDEPGHGSTIFVRMPLLAKGSRRT